MPQGARLDERAPARALLMPCMAQELETLAAENPNFKACAGCLVLWSRACALIPPTALLHARPPSQQVGLWHRLHFC